MSILAPSSGRTPEHQHLYGRGTSPSKSGLRGGRNSSLMLPPENRNTTPRGRKSALNSSRLSRPGRNSSVLSQRKSNSGSKRKGKADPPAPAIGGCTYVADVNPTFCVEGSIRFAEPINDRVAWTAEYDGSVRIRALPQGSELKQLEGRANTFCTCLLYLEQYQRMWAAFNDGFIRIYDSSSAKLQQEVVQHAGGVNCMIEMEGSVYTGGVDWKIGLWNPETSTFERLFFGHSGAVRALCPFNGPSGSILFSGSDDGTIRAWDPYAPVQTEEDRACLHIFKGHDRGVICLEALPHLSQLWSGGEDGTVRVWNLQTLEAVKVLKGHTAPVSTLLPVEARMWSGDKHGHIILWDISALTPLQEISSRMEGGRLGMVLTMKKIQPSSCWKVWTAGSTGFVQCWNAETVPIVFDAKNQYKYGNRGVHEMVLEMESFIQALQDELAAAKEDAGMNYERGRIEVQRELVAHQLLQEENEMLRNRIRQLEAGGGGGDGKSGGNYSSLLKDRGGVDSQTEFRSDSAELLSRTPASSPRDGAANPLTSTSGLASMMAGGGNAAGGPPAAAIFPPGDQYKGAVQSTPHSVVVRGNRWEAVAAHRPHQVRETAKEEVCMALGIPPAQLSKFTVEPVRPRTTPTSSYPSPDGGVRTPRGHQPQDRQEEPGLRVSCIVAHPGTLKSEEVQRRIEAFDYPRLNQLHSTSEELPKRGLDAAEERIRALERQLERALEASRASNKLNHSTSHSGAAYKDREVEADPLESDHNPPLDPRQQEKILRQQEEIQDLQQAVERLRDENDILRALLDEAADRSRSDALSSRRPPSLSAKEAAERSPEGLDALHAEEQGSAYVDHAEEEDPYRDAESHDPNVAGEMGRNDEVVADNAPYHPRQDDPTNENSPGILEYLRRPYDGQGEDEGQPRRKEDEDVDAERDPARQAALEEERRREEERVYYEYFGRPRPPSVGQADEDGLYSVSDATDDHERGPSDARPGEHKHGHGPGIMDFLDRTVGEDGDNRDGGHPHHSRPHHADGQPHGQQYPSQGQRPGDAGHRGHGPGIMDFLDRTVGEDGDNRDGGHPHHSRPHHADGQPYGQQYPSQGQRPGDAGYSGGATAPPSALKRPVQPVVSHSPRGGGDARQPVGQGGEGGSGSGGIGLPPRGNSGVSASPPRPTSHPEQYLPVEADPENVQQALQASRDLNEYLKNVVSEKERQRAALQREVEALRDEVDRMSRALQKQPLPLTDRPTSSSPAPVVVHDEEARRQITHLRDLLRQARHRSEATRRQLDDLVRAVGALRGSGGTPSRPARDPARALTPEHATTPLKQRSQRHAAPPPPPHQQQQRHHHPATPAAAAPASSSFSSSLNSPMMHPDMRTPQADRTNPPHHPVDLDLDRYRYPANRRRSPPYKNLSAQAPQRPSTAGSRLNVGYPDISTSTEESSALPQRLQRDSLHRPPYPTWATTGRDLLRRDGDNDEDRNGKSRLSGSKQPRRDREIRRPDAAVRASRDVPRLDSTSTSTLTLSPSQPTPRQSAETGAAPQRDHRLRPRHHSDPAPRHSDEQIAAANAVLAARVRDAEAVAALLKEQHRRSTGMR